MKSRLVTLLASPFVNLLAGIECPHCQTNSKLEHETTLFYTCASSFNDSRGSRPKPCAPVQNQVCVEFESRRVHRELARLIDPNEGVPSATPLLLPAFLFDAALRHVRSR